MDLERIQRALQAERLDGWLFYDFRRLNPIAYQVLHLPLEDMYTRRWFYFVPAQGTPCAIVSAVEAHVLRSLPGERRVFRDWQEMHACLRDLLQPAGLRVAMEYSPMNAIPYIARVDAGTLELVRSFGAEVVSSANLAQTFVAQLSARQVESHRDAGRRIISVKDALFALLKRDLLAGETLNEYDIQQRFHEMLRQAGVVVAEPPIVAANEHAGNPHYLPSAREYSPVRRGDLLLFDFWGHLPEPGAVYADYTWMAFAGTREEIPTHQREVFEIVRRARDSAIAFVRARLAAGERIEGRQVDDVARHVIAGAGYGDFFVHRTGHSITTAEHGDGANFDNLETQDERILLPRTCCSIEPGIYLPEFGVRSEVNLLLHERDAEVTGVPAQMEIVPLL
ncbi:MAG: M24 family metallopeptidase [Chloroflexota bacterium]|nr:M24 family metallopeptidase [Chloroflexota bacterium]